MNRMSIIIASLLLTATQVQAASRVWISEYAVAGALPSATLQVATLPSTVNQATLDISGGAQSSAAFNSSTKYIRLLCEVQCAVKGGGTATASDTVLPALTPEYFGVNPGATISIIAAP